MRKMISFIMVLAMCVSLTACAEIKQEETTSAPVSQLESEQEVVSEEQSAEESAVQDVETENEGVVITIPALLISNDDDGQLTMEQIGMGFLESRKNEDGSITYVIAEESYQPYLDAMREGAVTMLDHLADGDYSSIEKVEYDKLLKQVVVFVDQQAYDNSSDAYVIPGIGATLAEYHAFCGESVDTLEIVIQILNAETNEVLETSVYPGQAG